MIKLIIVNKKSLFCFFLLLFFSSHDVVAQEPTTAGSGDWTTFIGRFHPVIVHLPIGFLIAGAFVLVVGRLDRFAGWTKSADFLLFIGALSAIVASFSGYLLSLSGEYDEDTLTTHLWFGLSTSGLAIAALLIRGRSRLSADMKWAPRVNQVIALIILFTITMTGHYGGSLTHGSGYLTESMSSNAKKLFGIREVVHVVPQKIESINEAVFFRDVIYPIFRENCVSCHNSNKKKGQLVLDTENGIRAGGKSGKCIHPSGPEASELYKRIILPQGEKKRMPPEGKTSLSEVEVALIYIWIKDSASFTKKIKDLKNVDTTRLLIKKRYPQAKDAGIFAMAVNAPDLSAIEALRKTGVRVVPVAANQHYLELNFINTPEMSEDQLALLRKLQSQVTWMKMSRMKLSEKTMQVIAGMPNLTVLQMDQTNITDDYLKYLEKLNHLSTLNIYRTQVSYAGIEKLLLLKNLQKIFLWETNVDSAGILRIREKRKDLELF